ncbi:MAG: transporter [Pseudomonadota bacterium]
MHTILRAGAVGAALLHSISALADLARPDAHAPIGVMGDHVHKAGEYMFSYRYMTMEMEGNLLGSNSISPDTIVTTIPNRFFGAPGQPPTLRIVPTEMTMDMHMFGAMYAPTDKVTLMVMANYLQNDMDHLTYQGGMGTDVLGTFSTSTGGWGDTSVSALVSLIDRPATKVHTTLGVSLPTGSVEERDDILTPMNMRPTVRVPYPMQLGSGSYDPILGLTYSGYGGSMAWGAQWRSTLRVMDNDEDYRLGDSHSLTGWVSYMFSPSVSASVRLSYQDQDTIDGIDPRIRGPVQTADPDRLGGETTTAAVGVNFLARGALEGWRLGLEYSVPVEQDLNGPQLETDSTLTFGLQKAW